MQHRHISGEQVDANGDVIWYMVFVDKANVWPLIAVGLVLLIGFCVLGYVTYRARRRKLRTRYDWE